MVLFREPDGRKDPHTAEPNVDQGSTDQRSITSPFPPEGKFPNDPEDKKLLALSIETAVEQIDQSSGTTWNAALEAFAGLIQLRCMK